MSTTIQPQADSAYNRDQASTRHLLVDRRFTSILHEDFPILPAGTIRRALEGELQRQSISICAWASGTGEPARALLCWARKHRRGTYSVTAPPPSGNTSGADRGSDTASRMDGSLRGVLCDPAKLMEMAGRMAV